MDVTLIIPCHNEEAYVGETIDAAKRNGDGKFKEIVVVDNASTDRTAEVARAHGARVVFEADKGLPAARQAGFDATDSEYVAYVDADTLIPAGWIDKAEAAFKKYPRIVSLSGPRRYFGARWYRVWMLNAVWAVAPLTYYIVGFMILGGNFVVKREAVKAIDGFDRSIKFYGEDTDLARRLSKVGKTLFRMNFYAYASARRFEKEGIWRTNIRYVFNYLWPVFFHRPYTRDYVDVR